jgi:S1-C subfamily serine protease
MVKIQLFREVFVAFFLTALPVALGDEKVYEKAIPSAVLILTEEGGLGSGVLVDAEHRLVATANHVPGKNETVYVMFPEFDRTGRPVTETARYLGRNSLPAIRGKVIDRRPNIDLALIQLESVPLQARAMPLSAKGSREGQTVHVIGNSNYASGAMFGCVSGQVRNVYTKEAGPTSSLAGRVVLTSVATNRGDSGGPVINDAGELVAIVSQGTTGDGKSSQQVVDYSIDVSEVRSLLEANRPQRAAVAVTPSKLYGYSPPEPRMPAVAVTPSQTGIRPFSQLLPPGVGK